MNKGLRIQDLGPSNFGGSEYKLSLAVRFARHCGELRRDYGPEVGQPESHIELLLGGAMDLILCAHRVDFMPRFASHPAVIPQRAFQHGFRTDLSLDIFSGFSAMADDEPPIWLYTLVSVECDGHAFHSADTKEAKAQAAKDRARDRFLSRIGLRVLRFTGSEIQRDPMECAWEALEVARQVYESEDARRYFDELPQKFPSGDERAKMRRRLESPLRSVRVSDYGRAGQ